MTHWKKLSSAHYIYFIILEYHIRYGYKINVYIHGSTTWNMNYWCVYSHECRIIISGSDWLVHHRVSSVSSSLPDGRRLGDEEDNSWNITPLCSPTYRSPPITMDGEAPRHVDKLAKLPVKSSQQRQLNTKRNQSKAREGSQSKWNSLRTKDWITAIWNKSSCWQVTAHNMEKFDAFHNGCLQKICRTFWSEKISKKNCTGWPSEPAYHQLRWPGYVFRKDRDWTPEVVVRWTPAGKKSQGRPKTTWWRRWTLKGATTRPNDGWRVISSWGCGGLSKKVSTNLLHGLNKQAAALACLLVVHGSPWINR